MWSIKAFFLALKWFPRYFASARIHLMLCNTDTIQVRFNNEERIYETALDCVKFDGSNRYTFEVKPDAEIVVRRVTLYNWFNEIITFPLPPVHLKQGQEFCFKMNLDYPMKQRVIKDPLFVQDNFSRSKKEVN